MTPNIVNNKIEKFAGKLITFAEFYDMMKESRKSNPIYIYWTKLDGDRADRDMYWGKYTGDAVYDYQADGYMVLRSKTDRNEWRTVVLDTVDRCIYKDKIYRVR